MANVSKTFESDLRNEFNTAEQVYISFEDENCNNVEPNNATELAITIIQSEGDNIWERYKLPKKKLVDLKWVMNKINKDKVYESFAKDFKKILDGADLKDNFSLYPTTYGIGIHVVFSNEPKELMKTVNRILTENDIDFRTEYSEAHWVFRYVISKSEVNIKRMGEI